MGANESRDKLTLKKIVDYYNACDSINETARAFKISASTCKRVLITQGLNVSELQQPIADMMASGMSIEDIALQLGIKSKSVISYLPYDKGSYVVPNGDNKIRLKRMSKGLTQRQLADIIGVSQNDLSRWELGKVEPKASNLKLIADALKCGMDDLI